MFYSTEHMSHVGCKKSFKGRGSKPRSRVVRLGRWVWVTYLKESWVVSPSGKEATMGIRALQLGSTKCTTFHLKISLLNPGWVTQLEHCHTKRLQVSSLVGHVWEATS